MYQEKPKFQTKYVEVVPEAGTTCPLCNEGLLEEGKWGGMICRNCRTAIKESKWPKKEETPFQSAEPDSTVLGRIKMLEILVQQVKADTTAIVNYINNKK